MNVLSAWPGLLVLVLLVLASELCFRWRLPLRRAVLDESSSGRFLPQLEGLRGLMAAGVVVHHAFMNFIWAPRQGRWFNDGPVFYMELGIVPVIIFFNLTGFLFWSKLLRRPKIEVLPFLRARLKRLGPVYLFAMLLLFLLVAVLTGFHLQTSPGKLLAQAAIWLGFAVLGKPDMNHLPHTELLIAGTPWTLALEFQFYVLLLALPWFARKPYRLAYVLGGSALLYRVALALRTQVYAGHHPTWLPASDWLVMLTGQIAFGFGTGMVAAVVLHTWPKIRYVRSAAVSIGCVLLWLFSFMRPRGYFTVSLTVATGLIFLAVAYGNTLFGVLTSRAMLTMGRFSYSLYLCHGLVLSSCRYGILRWRGALPTSAAGTWATIAVASLLSIVVAVICHEWVEAPFMVNRSRINTGLPEIRRSFFRRNAHSHVSSAAER